VKLPYEESLYRMKKVSINGSLGRETSLHLM
jgi:hypothetical protein